MNTPAVQQHDKVTKIWGKGKSEIIWQVRVSVSSVINPLNRHAKLGKKLRRTAALLVGKKRILKYL